MRPEPAPGPWPELPLGPWRGTRDALHLWTQIVGKTLLAHAYPQNHWWHGTLRVSGRGLATAGPLRAGGRALDVEFDLVDHLLRFGLDGTTRTMPLASRSVHSFYDEYTAILRTLGFDRRIWTTPVEIPAPVPFDRDDVARPYDRAAAHRFWEVLRRCDDALAGLADGYVGKQSPVHFFWGSFDLACSRFSGRRAPGWPGQDAVTREAYSHEVISFGFWPGGVTHAGVEHLEPIVYAYAAPAPAGFQAVRVRPARGRYDERLAEFVLPYEEIRHGPDPGAEIRAFCEDVYAGAATLAGWDRAALERSA